MFPNSCPTDLKAYDWTKTVTPMFIATLSIMGFPGGSDSKESACSARDLGSIPGLGRSPEEGNGNPLQYSRLENPMNRGPWGGYSPWGRKESEMTEQLTLTHNNSKLEETKMFFSRGMSKQTVVHLFDEILFRNYKMSYLNWITLLYSRNYHNIVNYKLYFNLKKRAIEPKKLKSLVDTANWEKRLSLKRPHAI